MDQPQSPTKVYLVDDSIPVRERVAQMLRERAIDVVGQAGAPQAAIDGILATQPDVVVLDIQLQGGTGLEVLRAVRLAAPQIAFVVLSNNSGPAYRKIYRIEGAQRFLDKNAEFDQLAQTVLQLAQQRPNEDPRPSFRR